MVPAPTRRMDQRDKAAAPGKLPAIAFRHVGYWVFKDDRRTWECIAIVEASKFAEETIACDPFLGEKLDRMEILSEEREPRLGSDGVRISRRQRRPVPRNRPRRSELSPE